jgi:hypothetical protein
MSERLLTLSSDPEGATVHYTELPALKPGERFCAEWNTYLREVGRLLAEGQESKWVIVKGEMIVGTFKSLQLANAAGRLMVHEGEIEGPYLLRQVLADEPILKVRGYNLPWPSSRSQLARTA